MEGVRSRAGCSWSLEAQEAVKYPLVCRTVPKRINQSRLSVVFRVKNLLCFGLGSSYLFKVW